MNLLQNMGSLTKAHCKQELLRLSKNKRYAYER